MVKILLNKSELAASMGRHSSYVSAMCRAGYALSHGTKGTLESALNWLAENPDFRAKNAYKRRKADTAEPRSKAPNL